MDVRIQQRLIGALVILALVFLIVPVVLDGEGRIPEKITQIPPKPKRPDLSHIRVAEPVQDVLPALPEEPPEPVAAEPDPQAVADASGGDDGAGTIDEPGAAPAEVTADAWSVQVASFRDNEKASRLRDELRAEGYPTYVNEVILSDGTLFTQVLVGPETEIDRVRARKDEIKERTGLQGLVVRYKP